MPRIVVVGLGFMGQLIARRAVDAGYEVDGIDPVEDARRSFSASHPGASVASTVEGGPWASACAAFVVVRTTEQLLETFPLLVGAVDSAGAERPLVVFVVTTITPEVAAKLPALASASVRPIELPVTRGRIGATESLSALAGGPWQDDDLTLLRRVFDEVVCFGDYGEASLAKLLNNLACGYHVAVLDELMTIAARRGLDPTALRQVMILGSGSSYAASIIADVMGDLLAKDVELAESYVGKLPLIGVDAIEQRLARARRPR